MKLMGKSVLITGGAGFVGSHLADRIIRENPANLTIVDNFFLGKEVNLSDARKSFPDLKVIRVDASDLAAMRQIVTSEKTEVIFDLAVIPLPTSLVYPFWTFQTTTMAAATACELARAGDIQTLVHCSSSEAYGTAQYVPMDEKHPLAALTPYAAGKAAADQVVMSYYATFHIDTVIVRPFNQFGPRQNQDSYAGIIPKVIRQVKQGQTIEIYGDGEQTRDYIFVRDTADAFVRIYEHETTRGLVLNVGSGVEISVNDLVKMLLEVLCVPDHPVVHAAPRPGDVRRHCAGIGRSRELIGLNPPGVTHENLQETTDWYLFQGTNQERIA
jgi:UDP-glucose 4-epimerase